MSKYQNYPITLYYSDNCEKQTLEPIANDANERGFSVKFSNNLNEKSVIGIYCQHNQRPHASLSIVLLHDMAQRHDIWPYFWIHEPWNEFDIGILPGKVWVDKWKKMAGLRVAQPKIGVFEMGWPKADLIYKNTKIYNDKIKELKDKYKFKHEKSIIYAPSWENDSKQDQFVKALIDMPYNLLLKQAPWSNAYPEILSNINEMNEIHKNISDNVFIIDPEISIMHCFGISDLLISDESSVLLEASLYGLPSVAVGDWLIPDCDPPRKSSIPYDGIKVIDYKDLKETCIDMLSNLEIEKEKVLKLRDQHFSNLGESSKKIMDLIEGIVIDSKLKFTPLK